MGCGRFLSMAVVAATLLSCGGDSVDQEQLVATTAQLYYQYLLDGKYDDFVGGMDLHLSPSPSYKEQLRANAKMFVRQQEKMHKGIASIRVSGAEVDERNHAANAYLVFCYGDSTTEEVVVPMVERDKLWLMR